MSEEISICRICFDIEEETNPFISPCSCNGSSKYVHSSCLNKWRNISTNEEARTKCMECHTKYVLRYKYPLENNKLFVTYGMLSSISLRYVFAIIMGLILYGIEISDDYGYIESNLWTGVGRARSGCGAAIVGSTDQILSKIEAYKNLGIKAFIFSGYPHIEESDHFGTKVMPQLKTCSLPLEYGRIPSGIPDTPLGVGERK